MKKLLQLLLVGFISFATLAAEMSSSPVFQMRAVAEAPSNDSEQMVVVVNKDANQKETLNVLKKVLIDQTDVKSAKVIKDEQFGHPQIEIRFTKEGTKRFAQVTRDNLNKRLAIVIDGQLYSAPSIRSEISGGTAVIAGSFNEAEAKDLASKIMESLKK